MKRNLAFLLIITGATLAQTPAVAGKPAAKPSAATVKAVPQQTAAKAQPSAVKVIASPAKPASVSVQVAPAKPTVSIPSKGAVASPAKAAVVAPSAAKTGATTQKANSPAVVSAKPAAAPAKVAVVNAKPSPVPAKRVAEAKAPAKVPVKESPKPMAVAKGSVKTQTTVAVQDTKATDTDKKQAPKAINAVGRRDPFISPVVSLGAVGSGCSSGKRCLAIDQIALKGVVKSDVGMIAVVVNAMDKAYFLRENDPVFNGYVVKITGDSIVFKETFHDRLGKSLTRDITKTITRPAV
jgi:hypothetical protein